MNNKLESSSLIADALLKLKAIETILITKGICTQEELNVQITQISHNIIKEILQKANVPGDLDEIIKSIR